MESLSQASTSREPRKVLVPVDFSPACRKSFAQAIAVAHDPAQIILLHVLPPSGQPIGNLAHVIEVTMVRLREFARSCNGSAPVAVTPRVRCGMPFQEILAAATEDEVEMIVLATRSSDSLGDVSLSRTSDRVSRYARCPVLLVHGDDMVAAAVHHPRNQAITPQ